MSSFTNSDDETGTSVHETISALTATHRAPHESTTGVTASLAEPALGDKDSYIDQEEHTNLLQDHGTPIEDGPTKCPNKVFQFKGHRYKDIWKLADMLKKLHETKKWHGAPRNGSNLRKHIAAHIVTHRNPVKKGDVSVFGHSKELVAIAQASSSADETASLFYSLEQKAVLRWAYSKWGMESMTELKKPRTNDRLRVTGVSLHEDFRDRIGLLLGTTQTRSESDDPGHAKNALFAEMAIKFNDPEFKTCHPVKWKDAEDELASYDQLDPNAAEVFRVIRDHEDIDKLHRTTMKPYKDAMKKWVKDTGAGSGEEIRFVTWDETASWLEAKDTRFQNFDNSGRGEWLTWVYMLDKQFDNVLWSKYGTMRGIAARGDTGNSGGSVSGSDFNSSTASDNELVKLVKENMGNGKNAMDRIAKALESGMSGPNASIESLDQSSPSTSTVSRLTPPRLTPLAIVQKPLDQIVREKMAAIDSLKQDKRDAEENETNESIKRMRVNVADKTIWTLCQEINTASDAVNSEMGTD
jgi:hypothetical protein